MREIKFRAWDKVFKRIDEIDGYDLFLANGKVYEVTEESHGYQTYMSREDVSERYELMQYTGLKDSKRTKEYPNGQEIYEGDIYRFKWVQVFRKWWSTLEEKEEIDEKFKHDLSDYRDVYGAIEFSDGEFYLKYSYDSIPVRKIRMGEIQKTESQYHGDYTEKLFDFEKVGNIHENPELLEGSK